VENNGVGVITLLLISEYPEVQSLALRAFNNIAENGTFLKILIMFIYNMINKFNVIIFVL
jgi:hypothetical protein